MSVLRRVAAAERNYLRSRRAEIAWRPDDMGECRHLLSAMQQQKGEPHAETGENVALDAAAQTAMESFPPNHHRHQTCAGKLERLSLLEYRD